MRGNGDRRGGWIRTAIAVATLGLIAIFARSVDWGKAWTTLSTANAMFVALAVGANLATVVIKAVRWHLFLGAVGVRSPSLAVRSTFAGAALNNVVFANGGDAARVAAVATQARVSSADVLATLAVDKLCDLVTYSILFAVVAFTLPLPTELARWRTAILVGLASLAIAGGFTAWQTRSAGARAGASGPQSTTSRLGAYVRRLIAAIPAVASGPRLGVALLLAAVAWVGQWATFHLAAVAASYPASPATSLLALLTVNASFLIRLTPGNLGVFQFLFVLAATASGGDRDGAVGVAFLISLIQYIPVTSIGLMLASSLVGHGGTAADPGEPHAAKTTAQDDIVTAGQGE